MSKAININTQGAEIELRAIRYRIYILGGFGVRCGEFSISFKNKSTNEILKCSKSFWPVQAYAYGRRAKRVCIIDIPKEGLFEILFNKPETLIVRHSNIFLSSVITKPLNVDEIQVIVTPKIGMFPVLKW